MSEHNLTLVPAPKDTMVVAQSDGRLYRVSFSEFPHLDDPGEIDWCASVSKIIVGKIQETRTRFLTLEEVEVENTVATHQAPPGATGDMSLTVFGSFDGKNNEIEVNPTIIERDNGYVHAVCRVSAKNFSVQLRGTYNINTMVLTYHNHGKR